MNQIHVKALIAADKAIIEQVIGPSEPQGVKHTLPAGTIDATLAERGDRYGSFEHHAVIAQDLQDVLRKQAGWTNLAPDQKQALTVICDKIARMLNGDPTYRDNWHDIVGYAKLVDDRMLRDEQAKDKTAPLHKVIEEHFAGVNQRMDAREAQVRQMNAQTEAEARQLINEHVQRAHAQSMIKGGRKD